MSDSTDPSDQRAAGDLSAEGGSDAGVGESMNESMPDRRQQLLNESGVLGWDELVKHFARGVVVRVDAHVDLIDVAMSFCEDNTAAVTQWLDSGAVQRANDDDARRWTTDKPHFRCVVTAPWVLVQALDNSITRH